MANSKRDQNFIPTLSAASSADGSTIVPIKADPTSHAILVSDGTSGSDLSSADDRRDGNFVPAMMCVSSTDGITPVMLYADPATGAILVQSS